MVNSEVMVLRKFVYNGLILAEVRSLNRTKIRAPVYFLGAQKSFYPFNMR